MGKRLTKNSNDQIIFGVCSGIADYIDVDVTVVRLLTVTLALFNPVTILIYAFAGLIAPTD